MERLRARVSKELLERIERSKAEDVVSSSQELAAFLDQDSVFEEVIKPLAESGTINCVKDLPSAMNHKANGNKSFGSKDYEKAIRHYTMALKLMPLCSDSFNDLATIYGNRAASLHKAGLNWESIRDCDRAIALNESYSKAWYRRGLIKAEFRDFKGALLDMQAAFHHETSTIGKNHVEKELAEIRQKLEEAVNLQEVPLQGDPSKSLDRKNLQTEQYLSSDKQWGLRTTSEISAGSLVHFEEASAAVLLKEHRNTHCHLCLNALPADSVPCNGCAVSLYCSETCRGNATAEHAFECGGTAWAAVLPVDGILASRLLTSDQQIDLCHHYNKLASNSKVELHLIAVAIAKCLISRGRIESFGDLTAKLVLTIAKVRSNAVGVVQVRSPDKSAATHICSIEHVIIAQAVFAVGSKFNHSCNPNVFASFVNRSLRVHATSDLPASSPLELSYGAQVGEAPTSERREWLSEHYFFLCNCDSCRHGTVADMLHSAYSCSKPGCKGIVLGSVEDVDAKKISQNPDLKNFLVDHCDVSAQDIETASLVVRAGCCLKCKSVVDVEKALMTGEKCLRDLQSLEFNADELHEAISVAMKCAEQGSKCFHPFNKQTAQMEDALARLYCEAGEHLLAVEHSQKSIGVLEVNYGKDNVAVAYERLKLASIAQAGGISAIAEACLQMAAKAFIVHYGPDYEKVLQIS